MGLLPLLNVVHQGPEICREILPESAYGALNAALICGIPLPSGESKQLFLDTGLIHIMVVSGAHLAFLDRGLRQLPSLARWILLLTYCWLTGFGAPVMLAFWRRCWEGYLLRRGHSRLQLEAIAVLTALLFSPMWISSRSFLMSWTCALAFASPRFLPRGDAPLKIYLLLYAFTGAAPLTVLWNVLVAPLVAEILFPLALASLACPPLVNLTDLAWRWLLIFLEWGPTDAPATFFIAGSTLLWLPLLTHSLGIFLEVQWRRARAFS